MFELSRLVKELNKLKFLDSRLRVWTSSNHNLRNLRCYNYEIFKIMFFLFISQKNPQFFRQAGPIKIYIEIYLCVISFDIIYKGIKSEKNINIIL